MACTTPPPSSSSSSSSSSGVVVRTSHSHSRSRSYFQHDSSRRRCTPPPFSFYLVSAIHSTSCKQLAACSSHDDGFKEGLPRHDSIFTRRRDLSQGSGSRLGASSRWLNIPHSSAGRGRRRRLRGASHATTSSSTSPPSPSSLAKSTYLVAVFAALAKFVAVFREVLIAFAFGVGPIADAFGYASMMPSFFVAVLGGINGPLHSAVAGQLSRAKKHQEEEEEEEEEVPASDVVASASAASLLLTAPVAVLTFAFAPQIFDALAPGLAASATADAQLARSAGATMLRFMSPTVLLCGPLGVCFGALSANGEFRLPAASPALSSAAIIVAVAAYVLGPTQGNAPMAGALALAIGTTAGCLVQVLAQAARTAQLGLGEVWNPQFGVALAAVRCEVSRVVFGATSSTTAAVRSCASVVRVLLPATIATGSVQINAVVDLYFASSLGPGAAAGLGYAALLSSAPLGILSSALLVPLLPMLARQANDREAFASAVRGALLAGMVAACFVASVVGPLAPNAARVVLQRGAFDAAATAYVAPLVAGYAAGAVAGVWRDILVRAFYALGEGGIPFRAAFACALLNAVLDWACVNILNLGAGGLVVATALANACGAVWLLFALHRRVGGCRYGSLVGDVLRVLAYGAVTAVVARTLGQGLPALFLSSESTTTGPLWSWFVHLCCAFVSFLCASACFYGLCLKGGVLAAIHQLESVEK